jgi:hypothetical protein
MTQQKPESGRLTFTEAAKLIGVNEKSFYKYHKDICPQVVAHPRGKRAYVSRTRLIAWTKAEPEILNLWREGRTRTALKQKGVAGKRPRKRKTKATARRKKSLPGFVVFKGRDVMTALQGLGVKEPQAHATLRALVVDEEQVVLGCLHAEAEKFLAALEDPAKTAVRRALFAGSTCCDALREARLQGAVSDAWAFCPYCRKKLR